MVFTATTMIPQQSKDFNSENHESVNKSKKSQADEDSNKPGQQQGSNSKDVSAVDNLTISRGIRPEAEINWEKLRAQIVYDEMGNKIKFCDIFKKQKTIILFIRHFLDFITRDYVEDISVIPLEYLQNADVRLVVIGPAPCKFIKPFKQLTGLTYTLYVDPEREVYKALGCIEKLIAGPLENSKHVKSGFISGVASSIWRAMRSPAREFQGDVKQQGGAFIMGPGETVHFSHLDQNSTDHVSLNDILSKAGVMNVSFPKDPRIQEL